MVAWDQGWGTLQKGEGSFLIVVLAATFIKIYQMAYLKWMHFIIYTELYLKKS